MKIELFTPWSLSDNGERVIDRDGDEVCDLNDGDFASPRVVKGAARLIAAAPELLEAAEKVIEMNRQHAQDQYGDANKAESWACVTVLREAIAKATQP